MRVVICGGHLSPALAVVQKLKNDGVFYMGRNKSFEGDSAMSLEYREMEKLGIPFYSIKAARFQRKFTRYTFFSLGKFPVGFFQSYKILKKINPDVVIGFGGYVSIPVILVAHFLKIPTAIHEQTLEAGFANRILSKVSEKILISWESSAQFFPKEKIVLVGNPLREEIVAIKKVIKIKNKKPLIYVTGGSGGSHFINSVIEENLSNLLKNYSLIHQTGDSQKYKDYERLLEKRDNLSKELKENYEIHKFLSAKDAATYINKADLVVGRAGINTVTELICLEKPSLLIPLPFSQKKEQEKNANFLKDLGLAEIFYQDSNSKEFSELLSKMLENLQAYKLKKKVPLDGAAEKIVQILNEVSKKKNLEEK